MTVEPVWVNGEREPVRGPIFIGGVSGSGKTLLRLALSSHPRLAISRRTYMWTRFYNRYGDLGRPENLDRCLAAMLAHRPTMALCPDVSRIRREFQEGDPSYARLFALFHAHYAEQLGKARWGDQLGFVERYADEIFRSYPGAQMIHMVSDPRLFHGHHAGRGRPGAVGAVTARWLHSAMLARRNMRLYPDSYKVVRHEDLSSHFEATLRDICAFLREEFVPGMLTMEAALRFGDQKGDGSERSVPIATPAPSSEPPGARATDRVIAFIQAHAGAELSALGYVPEAVRLPVHERLLFYAFDWPVNVAGMVAWRAFLSRRTA